MRCSRREFNRLSALGGIARLGGVKVQEEETAVPMAIVKTAERLKNPLDDFSFQLEGA